MLFVQYKRLFSPVCNVWILCVWLSYAFVRFRRLRADNVFISALVYWACFEFFGVPDWSIMKVMKLIKQITHVCDVVYPRIVSKQYIVNKQL